MPPFGPPPPQPLPPPPRYLSMLLARNKATHFFVVYFSSWLYSIRPSVMHEPFVPPEHALLKSNFDESQDGIVVTPNQLRWKPPAMASGGKTDFIDGLITVSGSGSPALKVGMAVHLYSCDKSMANRAFCNADGDMLIGASLVHGSSLAGVRFHCSVLTLRFPDS